MGGRTSNLGMSVNTVYTVVYNGTTTALVNGEEKTISVSSCRPEGTLVLFGVRNAGSVTQLAATRIYSLKFINNWGIVRNFVPCINPNNEVGLYDLETKTFFGNNGTGTFTAGGEI